MFSQACVKNSVHWGGGVEHAWWGACKGVGRGEHAWQERWPLQRTVRKLHENERYCTDESGVGEP